jgi:hypothetical protein
MSDPVSRSDPASRRVETRLRRRLGTALLIGPVAGLVIGAVVAMLAFDSWGRGSIMVMVGAVIAGTFLALLWGGYSSLESPDPGREPSDTRRPLVDREDLVREESGDPIGDDPQQRLPDGRDG